tara:strand:- start:7531 stop:8049 length:519 start_codon:yes stop_codon:yes gene_type:complete
MRLDTSTYLGKNGYDIYKNKMNLIIKTSEFEKQSSELDDNFFLALENFKDSFMKYIENPKYAENKRVYQRDKADIIKYEQSSFLLDNSIQKNFDAVNKLIQEQDTINMQAKKIHDDLAAKYKNINTSDTVAGKMIVDKEYEYKIVYSKTILFITGSLGLFVYILRNYNSNKS